MNFSSDQIQAVHHTEGPCMVIAGPGAGKTAVVTERVWYLTREKGIDPEHILVITFTRAAAAEMESRYLKRSGKKDGVTFGTFHSVFFQILRQEYGFTADGILKDGERLNLLSAVLRRLYPELDFDAEILNGLLAEISRIKNNRLDPEKSTFGGNQIRLGEVIARYEQEVEHSGRLDFDDMLVMTYRLFIKKPEVLKKWQERYQYIMVDEFQDINQVQADTVYLIARPRHNLFIVGDDDQSIYRFRGARPEIMLEFAKNFKAVKTVKLEVNYRSEEAVVRAAGAVIRHNKARYAKKIRAGKKGGGEVVIRRFRDEIEECEETAELIRKTEKEGVPLDRIAVLVRTNHGALQVLSTFVERGIPFVTRDKVPNIFRHFVCRPLFGYLNYVTGIRTRENFLKFMNCPNRYIRREDLKLPTVDLQQLASELSKDPERNWMGKRMEQFEAQLQLLAQLKSPFAMINYVRKGLGYDAYVREEAENKGRDAEELLNVLDAVQESAREYKTISDWYAHIAAYTKKLDDTLRERGEIPKGKVMVSTLHASKGLEYDTVFILDVNERILPHEKSTDAESIEEERRMFYVGMTRAIRKLHLFSVSERYGKKMEESRFMKEVRQSDRVVFFT